MGCVSAHDVTGRLLSPEYAILSDKEMSLDEVRSAVEYGHGRGISIRDI